MSIDKRYREGKTTLSDAAHKANMSVWDFQQFLIEKGFVSSYSIEDLNEELDSLN